MPKLWPTLPATWRNNIARAHAGKRRDPAIGRKVSAALLTNPSHADRSRVQCLANAATGRVGAAFRRVEWTEQMDDALTTMLRDKRNREYIAIYIGVSYPTMLKQIRARAIAAETQDAR